MRRLTQSQIREVDLSNDHTSSNWIPNGISDRHTLPRTQRPRAAILIPFRQLNQPRLQQPKAQNLNDDNASVRLRTVHLDVGVKIRPAVSRDLPAMATWSGQVDHVFRPALESRDRLLLVALANGRFPIGHVLIDLSGIVSHLMVLAGFRDQGLGTALMAQAESAIRERGAGHATLMVEKTNEGAIRLYERLGYKRIAESTATWEDPMPDGTLRAVDHPSWVMRKEL